MAPKFPGLFACYPNRRNASKALTLVIEAIRWRDRGGSGRRGRRERQRGQRGRPTPCPAVLAAWRALGRAQGFTAIAPISTATSRGSLATCTVARAGVTPVK